MSSDGDRAQMYLDLAAKARAMAQGVMPAEHKKSMLSIADSYDRLAATTEARAKRDARCIDEQRG